MRKGHKLPNSSKAVKTCVLWLLMGEGEVRNLGSFKNSLFYQKMWEFWWVGVGRGFGIQLPTDLVLA